MRKQDIVVGASYADGKGNVRIVTGVGGTRFPGQMDEDTVTFKVTAKGRSPLHVGHEYNATRASFASWATTRVVGKPDAPHIVDTYASARGRTYVIGEPEYWERFDGDILASFTYQVTLDGEPVGKLFLSWTYCRSREEKPKWSASLADVRNRKLAWTEKTPYGLGFDVGPFETIEECLAVWSRGVDALLDWRAANPEPVYETRSPTPPKPKRASRR